MVWHYVYVLTPIVKRSANYDIILKCSVTVKSVINSYSVRYTYLNWIRMNCFFFWPLTDFLHLLPNLIADHFTDSVLTKYTPHYGLRHATLEVSHLSLYHIPLWLKPLCRTLTTKTSYDTNRRKIISSCIYKQLTKYILHTTIKNIQGKVF